MRVAALPLLALTIAPVLAGCDSLSSETITFKDRVRICAYPASLSSEPPIGNTSPAYTYAADEAVRFAVTMPACLSSSCSKDPQASCTVQLDGSTLKVSSAGSHRKEGTTCTDDCGFLVARCNSAVLSAGTYTVEHGTERLTLTVPAMIPAPCAGSAP